MQPEELLAHTEFVRALARRLVLDEHHAADVSQEAWLAALQHPPAEGRPIKPWLSAVVRNFVSNFRRKEYRRTKRELAVTRPQRAPSSEEISIREEARSQVIAAVQQLEEPFRATILLRFYENLSPREVAELQGVPLETVRSRQKRGLELLRRRLDAEYGNDREAWCVALAPLAGLKVVAPAAGTAAAAGVSSLVLKAAIGLFFLCTAALTIWYLSAGRDEGRSHDLAVHGIEGEPSVRTEQVPGTDPVKAGRHGLSDTARERIEPEGIVISGKIIDRLTAEPLAAYDFRLVRTEESKPVWECVHETVRDDDGRFVFALGEPGTYRAEVCSSRHRTAVFPGLEVSADSGLKGIEWALDPGLSISGRVIDDRTGAPVAGALLGSDFLQNSSFPAETVGFGYSIAEGFTESELHAVTDSSGAFRLSGLEEKVQKIAALAPGYAQAWLDVDPDASGTIVLRLQRGFRVSGRALNDRNDPAAGVQIHMRGGSFPLGRTYVTAPDGSFTTEPVAPGLVALWAAPGLDAPNDRSFTPEMKLITIGDRDEFVTFGCASPEYATWRGTVLDSGGVAVAGGALSLRTDLSFSWEHPHYREIFFDRYVPIDGEGRFEALKLVPGRYNLWVTSSWGADLESRTITIDHPGLLERDIRISSGSSISGRVIDGNTGLPLQDDTAWVLARLADPSQGRSFYAFVGDDGTFALASLPAGLYTLSAGRYYRDDVAAKIGAIRLDGKESRDDVAIVIPCQGRVKMRFTGFDYEEIAGLVCSIHGAAEARFLSGRKASIVDVRGTGEIVHSLEAGQWSLVVASRSEAEFGWYECGFEVSPGMTTELEVERGDIVSFRGSVVLSGRLTGPRTALWQEAVVALEPLWVDEAERNGALIPDSVSALAGPDGIFTLPDLVPGYWGVRVFLSDGGMIRLPDRVIPPTRSGDFFLDLEIPTCAMTGVLRDARTMKSPPPEHLSWRIALYDPHLPALRAFWEPACEQQGDGTNRFSLAGVPQGQYLLLVEAKGYAPRLIEGCTLIPGAQTEVVVELFPE